MFKRVLVYTYGEQEHDTTLKLAAQFAADHQAHLIGLYIKPDYANYGSVYGPFPFALVESLYEKLDEFAAQNQGAFEAALKATGASGEWHSMDQYAEGPNPALYVDCIFVSQPSKKIDATFNSPHFVDEALISTGLPVIVVPQDYQGDRVFECPLIGWKESKEAANAVRQCIAILRHKDLINVVNVSSNPAADKQLVDGIQISEFLAAHNVKCEFSNLTVETPSKSVAETLVAHAQNQQNDLIIVGGYSHSRLREIIFGGVTRELLEKSTIPILMVH